MSVKPPSGGKVVLLVTIVGSAVFAAALIVAQRMRPPEPAAASPAARGDWLKELDDAGRKKAVQEVARACDPAPRACSCLQAEAKAALGANLHEEAMQALSADATCAKQIESRGMRAEALTRAGKHDEARKLALEVRETNPKDPFAAYALGHVAFKKADVVGTLGHAISAQKFGRGAPAYLLSALVQFHLNHFDGARADLEKMLELDPFDVDALYNLALISQKTDHYREAREGYLKVLKVAPKNADARYNLGILTHSVGAMDEARHNLERLQAITSPDDERVKNLKAVLAGPPPPKSAGLVFAKPKPSYAVPPAASTTPPTP